VALNDPKIKSKNSNSNNTNNSKKDIGKPVIAPNTINNDSKNTKNRNVDAKDTGRSNVMQQNTNPKNENKRDLIMDQALKKAKLEHEKRMNEEKNKPNKANNPPPKQRDQSKDKWAHEKNDQFIKREVNRVVSIQNIQQFDEGKMIQDINMLYRELKFNFLFLKP